MRTITADRFVWRHADDPSDGELRGNLEGGGYQTRHIELATHRNVVTLAEVDGDRLFVLLQVLGKEGRLFQLSLFAEEAALISVLGPRPSEFDDDAGGALATALMGRADEFRRPSDVVGAAIAEIAEALERELNEAANAAGALDREMRTALPRDPERFLERAFSTRHDLVTIGNRITQTREACSVIAGSGLDGAQVSGALPRDRLTQLRARLDGEAEFLQGVLDYYQSLTNTKMNIAMERLAVIAAVTLPVSAIGGILGMNTIVSDETNVLANTLTVVLMLVLTIWMLVYARRRGWW